MREIKFRAWDGSSMSQNAKTIQEIASVGVQSRDPEKLEWLQYTGLKDKNGKEIYDGDVFGVTWSDGSIRPAWIVDWHKGYACWGFKSINRKSSIYRPLISEWKRKVVIGNIYENPELLK